LAAICPVVCEEKIFMWISHRIWNDPWVVLFHNCVHQRRPVSMMAAITKNRNYFKWPKLLYCKPESWDWLSSFRGEDFFFISSPFFLFLVWWPSWLEVGITGHKFGREPSKDHSTKVWLCPPVRPFDQHGPHNRT
jgi:hypothetical protein